MGLISFRFTESLPALRSHDSKLSEMSMNKITQKQDAMVFSFSFLILIPSMLLKI